MEYFEKIIDNAIKIRLKLSDIGEYQNGQVHFRPTSTGITMVSLLPHSPQLGKGGYCANSLKVNFQEEYNRYCRENTPRRATPEKQLQSYLISDAYKNNRKFNALRYTHSDAALDSIIFISDEFVIMESDSKCICDLLALRVENTAVVPVILELKSTRAMTELCNQLNTFTSYMLKLYHQFELFYGAVLGQEIRFAAKPEKWIIWPNGGAGEDRQQDVLSKKGIGVVQYTPLNGSYMFHVGRRPNR